MKTITKQIILLLALLLGTVTYAQVGIGTTSPNPSSALDIESTDSGLLIPRMTTAQRTGIATPAEGLQVYDITTSSLWYYDGTSWVDGTAANNIYTADGTLAGNRQVTMGAFDLGFTGTGNVGIGTTSPDAALSVKNSILMDNYTATNSDITGLVNGSNFGGLIQGHESGQLVVGLRDNDGNDAFTIVSGGGNYTTDSTYDLNVASFKANGSVGIGTNAPTQTLDVNGAVRLRSFMFDSNNSPGTNTQFLGRDVGGVIWKDLPPIQAPLASSVTNLISGNQVQRRALTGDVTAPANSNATTITNLAVTNAKLANNAVNSIKIQDNTITTSDVLDNTLNPQHRL